MACDDCNYYHMNAMELTNMVAELEAELKQQKEDYASLYNAAIDAEREVKQLREAAIDVVGFHRLDRPISGAVRQLERVLNGSEK